MPEISAVIITLNEERNIARCIDSLQGIADEILVLDSFSTDRTAEICKSKKIKFLKRKWEGYSASKNFANQQARYDWILSIDADEAVSENLARSIAAIKNKNRNQNNLVYQFNRLTNYCGKWIKHSGWYPDTKVRIFNKKYVYWQNEIHETLYIPNDFEHIHLKGDLLHYSYYSIAEHQFQIEKFTTLSANSLFAAGIRPSLIKRYLSPIFKFIKDYFFRLGFLDGKYGYVVCMSSARATFIKYEKLKTLWKEKEFKNS
jgi:glycosyltransferase involved in cell wall biosynthesis